MTSKSKMSQNSLRTLWEKHLESTIQLNFKANDQPRYVTYRNPGLNYFTDYDRNGLPNLVRLMLYTAAAEHFANRMPVPIDSGEISGYVHWEKLLQDRTMFVASTEFTFSRTLYNRHTPKWPLNVKVSLGGMGSSSLLTKMEISTEHSQEPVITKLTKMVSVDTKTRRPLTLPDWFIEDLRGKEEKMPDFKFTGFDKPTNTFVRRVQVVWSHTDSNNHTNFSSYVLFGLDSLHLFLAQEGKAQGQGHHRFALESQTTDTATVPEINLGTMKAPAAVASINCNGCASPIPWITEEILKNGVKNLQICYMMECVEGDILNVHIWQESREELKLRCSVEALDGATLCQYIIQYFAPSSSL